MNIISIGFAGAGCIPGLGIIGSSGGAAYSATQTIHYLARLLLSPLCLPCLSKRKIFFIHTIKLLAFHTLSLVLHVVNIATLTLIPSFLVPLYLIKLKQKAIPLEFRKPLRSLPVDFSVGHPPSREKCAKKIFTLFAKIVLFPWGAYCLIRYLIQRMIMAIVYPAQSAASNIPVAQLAIRDIPEIFFHSITKFKATAKRIVLERNGVRYEGVSITNPSTIKSKKWVLYSLGNCCSMEFISEKEMQYFLSKGFNILSINGPGIGKSEGTATPKTLGRVQELGLRYLEEKAEAIEIIMAGYSFGGANISEAILAHHIFKKEIQYLVLRIFTFDTLSNIASHFSKLPPSFIKKLFLWTKCETGSIEASKKLLRLGIPEITYQGDKDTTMERNVSFATYAEIHRHGIVYHLPNATHEDQEAAILHFFG